MASLFTIFRLVFFLKFLFPACLVAPEADYSRKIDTIDSPWYSGSFFSLVCYFFNFVLLLCMVKWLSRQTILAKSIVHSIQVRCFISFSVSIIVSMHCIVALEADYSRKIDSPQNSGSFFLFLLLFLCIV